jgi:predicted dehydrogenase
MSRHPSTVLLVGGGRWGRVHAANLSELLTSNDRVLWVTRHNQTAAAELVKSLSRGPRFDLSRSLQEALDLRPDAALIVTSPDSHVAMAEACLSAGTPSFVEKPLACRREGALKLIEIAERNKVLLAAGLHLLSASYLHHFKQQISGRELLRIGIRWFDPAHEIRYGESKRADETTPIVHDLYPHIWAIVRVLTGCDRQIISAASKQRNDLSFQCSAFEVVVDARCGRCAALRERKIEVDFRDGGSASLDFTEEPGQILLDGAPGPSDPNWGKEPRPVMAEVRDFLKRRSQPSGDKTWPHLAENCIDSVTGAEAVDLISSTRFKR